MGFLCQCPRCSITLQRRQITFLINYLRGPSVLSYFDEIKIKFVLFCTFHTYQVSVSSFSIPHFFILISLLPPLYFPISSLLNPTSFPRHSVHLPISNLFTTFILLHPRLSLPHSRHSSPHLGPSSSLQSASPWVCARRMWRAASGGRTRRSAWLESRGPATALSFPRTPPPPASTPWWAAPAACWRRRRVG